MVPYDLNHIFDTQTKYLSEELFSVSISFVAFREYAK